MTRKFINLSISKNPLNSQVKITRDQRDLNQRVFSFNQTGQDKIIITVINTGPGIPAKTAKGLLKLFLDKSDSF